MTHPDIQPIVADVLCQALDLEDTDLSPQVALEVLPEWDSVNALRVLVLLEREVGGPIDFEGFVAATTVGALGDLVTATLAGTTATAASVPAGR